MICLCLAIASIGRAMQRQADNRHHMITQVSYLAKCFCTCTGLCVFFWQGLAFLTKYRDIRGDESGNMDEVEYNFGRAFHQLGLFTLASKHYTRVLEIVELRQQTNAEVRPNPCIKIKLLTSLKDFGVAREAAYNLSSIYVTTGATPLAQALYRRWLSL